VPGSVGVSDVPEASGVVETSAVYLPDPLSATTLTADPGTSGTTLAVTANTLFPGAAPYYVRVENEVMLVSAGAAGTSWTVARGQMGTTGAAHAIGTPVYLMSLAQRVVNMDERITTFSGVAAAFRTLGTAATPQNLFSIENGSGSPVLVAVKRLSVEMDATAVLTTVAPEFVCYRQTTLPTGGTSLTKVATDTALASNTSVVLRGGTASDGGAATAITATASANRAWHQFEMRQATAVGQLLMDDSYLIPGYSNDDPVILRASEALLVQVIGTAASNAATNHYVVKCAWEEFRVAV
jgi:hypothetical protein